MIKLEGIDSARAHQETMRLRVALGQGEGKQAFTVDATAELLPIRTTEHYPRACNRPTGLVDDLPRDSGIRPRWKGAPHQKKEKHTTTSPGAPRGHASTQHSTGDRDHRDPRKE